LEQQIALAVMGGSGFYEMPGLTDIETFDVDTPFGKPSDTIRVGTLEGRRVAFLARHGAGHKYLPAEIPQRANFWALKSLGVRRVLGVSAVGSLRADYEPEQLVVPDQIIDRTRTDRPETFFGNGIVGHVSMAHPFSEELSALTAAAAREAGATVHEGGSYIVIDGPAFGTKAESELYRQWGASIVGMTALPEAKLAREAEMSYALLTAVTDYDSWHESEAHVDANTVFTVLAQNVDRSRGAIRNLARTLPADGSGGGEQVLDTAIVTPMDALSAEVRERLAPILARWLEGGAS
jgi:5'-methylthioadenosine phosphorylase